VRGPRDHGNAHDGAPPRSHLDDDGRAADDVLGALAGLHARDRRADSRVTPRASPVDGRHVSIQRDHRADRRVGDVEDGQAAQGEAVAVLDRAAAVSLAALARCAADDVETRSRCTRRAQQRKTRRSRRSKRCSSSTATADGSAI
jgi:hypothetical protein